MQCIWTKVIYPLKFFIFRIKKMVSVVVEIGKQVWFIKSSFLIDTPVTTVITKRQFSCYIFNSSSVSHTPHTCISLRILLSLFVECLARKWLCMCRFPRTPLLLFLLLLLFRHALLLRVLYLSKWSDAIFICRIMLCSASIQGIPYFSAC